MREKNDFLADSFDVDLPSDVSTMDVTVVEDRRLRLASIAIFPVMEPNSCPETCARSTKGYHPLSDDRYIAVVEKRNRRMTSRTFQPWL